MSRPAHMIIEPSALLHNVNEVKRQVAHKKIMAMVKANAYGCGLAAIVPVLEKEVEMFGVACLEEAMAIRALGIVRPCVLMQGIFSQDEVPKLAEHNFHCVLHQPQQLQWLLQIPLTKPVTVWVKVNTGMNRLGFALTDIYAVLTALQACPWVSKPIGLMTHMACADEPDNPFNRQQLSLYETLSLPDMPLIKSIANSAAIMAFPEAHADIVRPGIMLYGASPFAGKTGKDHGLRPVMRFVSALSAIRHCPEGVSIGYGAAWKMSKPALIGIVAAGYGDGYPRHIHPDTPVWINDHFVPVVGRVSMDLLTVDLSSYPEAQVGEPVELWGEHVPVEVVAQSAGTLAYELLCQISPRVR